MPIRIGEAVFNFSLGNVSADVRVLLANSS